VLLKSTVPPVNVALRKETRPLCADNQSDHGLISVRQSEKGEHRRYLQQELEEIARLSEKPSPEHTRLMGARYTSPPGRAKAPVGQTIGDGTSHLLAELHRPSQRGSEAFQLAEGLPIHPLLLDGQHRNLCPADIHPIRGRYRAVVAQVA
jgi:hypothetical protein